VASSACDAALKDSSADREAAEADGSGSQARFLLLLLLGQLELLLLLQFPLLLTKCCNDWPAGNSKLFSSTYVAERSLNPAAACDADASRVPQAANGALMQLRLAGNDCMLPQLLLALCGCQDQQGPAVAP
jgi:hypothetical protein